jgi:hypothetical protein
VLRAHPFQEFNTGWNLRRSNYGFIFDRVAVDSDLCSLVQDGGEDEDGVRDESYHGHKLTQPLARYRGNESGRSPV